MTTRQTVGPLGLSRSDIALSVVLLILLIVGVVVGVIAWVTAPTGSDVIIEPSETDQSAALPLPLARELLVTLDSSPVCSSGSVATDGALWAGGSVYERSLVSALGDDPDSANCTWSFDLDGEWDVFATSIGVLEPPLGGEQVQFVVKGDGEILSQYLVSDPALELTLDVSGINTLELEVINLSSDPLEALWGNPRIFSYADS